MLAIFCVRLALGLILFLPLLWRCSPHPRFVRTQFLTALGLTAIATASAWGEASAGLRGGLIAATGLAFLGAFTWTFEPARGGRLITVAFAAVTIGTLALLETAGIDSSAWAGVARTLNGVLSAALLGSVM